MTVFAPARLDYRCNALLDNHGGLSYTIHVMNRNARLRVTCGDRMSRRATPTALVALLALLLFMPMHANAMNSGIRYGVRGPGGFYGLIEDVGCMSCNGRPPSPSGRTDVCFGPVSFTVPMHASDVLLFLLFAMLLQAGIISVACVVYSRRMAKADSREWLRCPPSPEGRFEHSPRFQAWDYSKGTSRPDG